MLFAFEWLREVTENWLVLIYSYVFIIFSCSYALENCHILYCFFKYETHHWQAWPWPKLTNNLARLSQHDSLLESMMSLTLAQQSYKIINRLKCKDSRKRKLNTSELHRYRGTRKRCSHFSKASERTRSCSSKKVKVFVQLHILMYNIQMESKVNSKGQKSMCKKKILHLFLNIGIKYMYEKKPLFYPCKAVNTLHQYSVLACYSEAEEIVIMQIITLSSLFF